MESTMAENKFERVAEDDPRRCQAVIQSGSHAGQCFYKAVEHGTYCLMHGGGKQESIHKKALVSQYRLQQYSERVADFACNPEVKNLREEIGITRMVLETLIVACENANKLVVYSDKIVHLVDKIQKLVESAQRLEERNNGLLDRKIVIIIADSIVTLIGEYITDPDKLNEIGAKICESITRAASPTDSARVVA
jgi:hypothetical protein